VKLSGGQVGSSWRAFVRFTFTALLGKCFVLLRQQLCMNGKSVYVQYGYERVKRNQGYVVYETE